MSQKTDEVIGSSSPMALFKIFPKERFKSKFKLGIFREHFWLSNVISPSKFGNSFLEIWAKTQAGIEPSSPIE
jgi:hypothetical protein